MSPGRLTKILCALVTLVTVSLVSDDLKEFLGGNPISQAQAQARRGVRHHHRRPVHRPAYRHAPVTARGVARRTTRRVVRRNVYLATLPVGCRVVHVNGIGYHHCGSLYYQRSGSRYVQVNIY
ncbi:hypothetical protein FJ938_18980 [Mesorhizobium sp. B2-4-14]|nr:hypothetical protein FJ938_18980 [Mesorhizobium sp. B2-4-14]